MSEEVTEKNVKPPADWPDRSLNYIEMLALLVAALIGITFGWWLSGK